MGKDKGTKHSKDKKRKRDKEEDDDKRRKQAAKMVRLRLALMVCSACATAYLMFRMQQPSSITMVSLPPSGQGDLGPLKEEVRRRQRRARRAEVRVGQEDREGHRERRQHQGLHQEGRAGAAAAARGATVDLAMQTKAVLLPARQAVVRGQHAGQQCSMSRRHADCCSIVGVFALDQIFRAERSIELAGGQPEGAEAARGAGAGQALP